MRLGMGHLSAERDLQLWAWILQWKSGSKSKVSALFWAFGSCANAWTEEICPLWASRWTAHSLVMLLLVLWLASPSFRDLSPELLELAQKTHGAEAQRSSSVNALTL